MGEPELRAVALGGLLPAAIAAAILTTNERLPSKWQAHAHVAGALALATAVCGGYFTLGLGPLCPRSAGINWLPHLTVLAIPASRLCTYPRRFGVRLAALGPTAAVAGVMIIPDWWKLIFISIFVLTCVAGVTGVVLTYTRLPTTALTVVVAAMGAAAAHVLLNAALARLTQIAGLLFAVGAGAMLFSALLNRDPEGRAIRGMLPGMVLLLVGLMFSGYINSYSEVPAVCYAAVALAPTTLLITRIPSLRRHPMLRVAIGIAALAVPLAFAVTRAVLA